MLQFIGSPRIMASSSNLVNNLSKGLHKIIWETYRIKCKHCDCFLEYTNFKDDLVEYKFLSCSKSYQRKFDEKLKERYFNTYRFSSKKVFMLVNIWMIGKN